MKSEAWVSTLMIHRRYVQYDPLLLFLAVWWKRLHRLDRTTNSCLDDCFLLDAMLTETPMQKIDKDSAGRNFAGRLKRTLSNQGSSAESRGYFVRQQLRGQLAHDLWWIVLSIFFIMITETSNFERDPVSYSAFNVIFEVVSAYGCVGISVGLPNVAYSFSGGWHKVSKLILCAVMIRGRHRGLPVAIDRAILLPGEHLAAAEEEDAQIRLERSTTINRASV